MFINEQNNVDHCRDYILAARSITKILLKEQRKKITGNFTAIIYLGTFIQGGYKVD